MGLFDRRKNRIKNAANVEKLSYEDFQRGIINTPKQYNAMNLSGVFQCVDLISDTISKLPFYVMNDRTKEHLDRPDIYNLLNLSPNPVMNGQQFKKLWITNMLLTGNGYVVPTWRGLKVTELNIFDKENVQIVQNDTSRIVYVVRNPFTKVERKLRYDEIIHLKAYTADGITGISPLTFARLTTEVGLEQEAFQKAFYTNGGRPDGVLKTATDLSNKQVAVKKTDGSTESVGMKEAMRRAWRAAHTGTDNRFDIAILDNGLEYQTIPQISPADMDFVNSKTVNIEDICRFFKVPPYKLGVGKQTYSNNEQASIEYITNTIIPIVTQIEQELTRKLLLDSEIQRGLVVTCNVEAELRGDTNARANWYQKMEQMGVYTINEIRALENMEEVEYGDTRVIGPNYVPIEIAIKGGTAGDVTPNPISDPPTKEEQSDGDQENSDQQTDGQQTDGE